MASAAVWSAAIASLDPDPMERRAALSRPDEIDHLGGKPYPDRTRPSGPADPALPIPRSWTGPALLLAELPANRLAYRFGSAASLAAAGGAALLALGSTSLIATVVPVPDDASHPLMLLLHRHLRAGASPAAALARAQRSLAAADTTGGVATTGFLCYGAG